MAVTIGAVAVLLYVVLLALHVLSLRLEVRPGEVTVRSVLARQRYSIEDGRVKRLAVEPRKGIFGTQLGAFGIELGLGRAPSRGALDVVRLAPTPTVIVVPSSPTRLAVVPSSERTLLRALDLAAERIGRDVQRVTGHEGRSRA